MPCICKTVVSVHRFRINVPPVEMQSLRLGFKCMILFIISAFSPKGHCDQSKDPGLPPDIFPEILVEAEQEFVEELIYDSDFLGNLCA